MTLIEALRDRLLACPPVVAKVNTRIYALKFPQSLTAPAIRMFEVDRVSDMHLRGDVGLRRARVQIDCVEAELHGDPYDGAHQLADAVRGDLTSGTPSGLVGFQGVQSGLRIAGVLADTEREFWDADANLVRVEQDFVVWFHVP